MDRKKLEKKLEGVQENELLLIENPNEDLYIGHYIPPLQKISDTNVILRLWCPLSVVFSHPQVKLDWGNVKGIEQTLKVPKIYSEVLKGIKLSEIGDVITERDIMIYYLKEKGLHEIAKAVRDKQYSTEL